MATFSLDNFKAEINKSGLSWTDRFEVIISPPESIALSPNSADYNQSNLISLYAEHVSFPQLSVENKRLQIFGASSPRPVGISYGGDALSMTFLLDSEMKIKTMFDYWTQSIISNDSFLVAYQKDYTCSIRIRQLDKTDKVTYECLIEDAYPFSMQQVDLNHSAQNSVSRLNVTFAYRKWQNVGLPDFGANATQGKRDSNVQITRLADASTTSPSTGGASGDW